MFVNGFINLCLFFFLSSPMVLNTAHAPHVLRYYFKHYNVCKEIIISCNPNISVDVVFQPSPVYWGWSWLYRKKFYSTQHWLALSLRPDMMCRQSGIGATHSCLVTHMRVCHTQHWIAIEKKLNAEDIQVFMVLKFAVSAAWIPLNILTYVYRSTLVTVVDSQLSV